MTAPAPAAAQAAPAKPLSAKARKAAREAARREVQRAERERIEAARASEAGGTRASTPEAAPDAAPAPSAAPLAPPPGPERTDDDRARDAAMCLRGVVFPLLSLLAGWFSYRLDLAAFTEAQALEDGKAWVPLCRRYRFLDVLVTWASAPARLVARARELARSRPKDAPP